MVSIKYCILGVEGPHDQAFVGKLLSKSGLQRYDGDRKKIDPFWEKFIPTYPRKGKLYDRLDMPTIFFSQTHSIAIYQGEGDNLCTNLKDKMGEHDPYVKEINAFGLVIDAETKEPNKVAEKHVAAMRELFPTMLDKPGIITDEKPRTGIFVLPDNKRYGALDVVLVNCASVIYPDQREGATHFIDNLDSRYKEHWRPYGREKAIVASIVSVLKPGAANTASIAQDEWICAETIDTVADVKLLNRFLKDLLQLPERQVVLTQ